MAKGPLDTRQNYGVGVRGGRRPKKYRVEKADLEPIIRRLYEMGFGCQVVGRMLGYSGAMIHLYARDFGLAPASASVKAATMAALLPADLKAEIGKIRMKSEIAHERKRDKPRPLPQIHVLADE